jgi:hypothetical protein
VIAPGQSPPPNLPKDVQALLGQFQQQRNQLMSNLQGATEAQRQQVLGQLGQLREQLQAQIEGMRRQAKSQVVDMRQQFAGHFGPGNASQGGSASPGHGGKPRH